METITLAEKQELCAAKVTLNGKPARVNGYRNEFATVTQKETGLSAEWNWHAVKRIINKGGNFQS